MPESTDWLRVGKIAGGVVAGALLLWVAYKQATHVDRSPVVAVQRPAPPRVVYVNVPQAPPLAPKPAPVEPAPPEPKPEEHSTVFDAVAPVPIVHAPELQPDRPREKPKSLRERMDSCIMLTGERNSGVFSPEGVQVIVAAHNSCGESFPGNERWFKVYTVSANGSFLGSEEGRFQTTIPNNGTMTTEVFVHCDPNSVASYKFVPWP